MLEPDVGFVFLAGGGMSAWVWRDLEHGLRSRSVLVEGRLAHNSLQERKHASLSDCVDHIQEQVATSRYRRLIVVAHSGAGILAPQVARRMSDRVVGIIFVAAGIPPNGRSILDAMPLGIRILNAVAARAQFRADSSPARRHEATIRRVFCNTASPAVIDYVLEQRLLTEPLCVFRERMDWSNLPKIPMTYVRLLEDRTASLELQDRMAGNLGISDRLDLSSDHLVMLSHPAEFGAAIRSIARRQAVSA